MSDNHHITSFEKKLLRQITAQDRAVSALFDEFTRSITPMLTRYNRPPILSDVWLMNKDIESAIDLELRKLQKSIKDYTLLQTGKAWNLSADKTDLIVNDYIKNLSLSDIAKDGLFIRNLDALKEFQARSVNGMGLSDRVWKICQETKEQMELYMQSGLATGRSAADLSRDVRRYLKDPDARFRRVRDPETGKLVMSKPMADYHPGQGVYRSAFKNALRMTRTETNMAYRSSDMERWKKIDFVKGYEVKLSNNHYALDMCDYLKGEYPKTFFFDSWHPNCYCYCVPILPSQDDFVSYINTDKLSGSSIKGIPPMAAKYIKDKSAAFAGMKNKPNWLNRNFASRNGNYYPKKLVDKPPKISGVIKENQSPFDPKAYNNYKSYPELDKKISSLRKDGTILRSMSNEDFVSLAGDTPGKGLTFNKVETSFHGDASGGTIEMVIKSNQSFTKIQINKYRQSILEIAHTDIIAAEQGKGLGSKMFLNTLEAAKKNGFSFIELTAAKANGYNGYYTWARYGFEFNPVYTSEITRFKSLVSQSGISEIKNCQNLKELFKTRQGADFWSKNGFEFHGVFDVKLDYDAFISYFRSKNYPI